MKRPNVKRSEFIVPARMRFRARLMKLFLFSIPSFSPYLPLALVFLSLYDNVNLKELLYQTFLSCSNTLFIKAYFKKTFQVFPSILFDNPVSLIQFNNIKWEKNPYISACSMSVRAASVRKAMSVRAASIANQLCGQKLPWTLRTWPYDELALFEGCIGPLH